MASRLAPTNGKQTRRLPEVGTVRVQCQADNPDPKLHGTPCGQVLGDIPATHRFAGLSARAPNPDGRIRMKCSRNDCRTWNIFDVPHE